jgi:hypothetical protein
VKAAAVAGSLARPFAAVAVGGGPARPYGAVAVGGGPARPFGAIAVSGGAARPCGAAAVAGGLTLCRGASVWVMTPARRAVAAVGTRRRPVITSPSTELTDMSQLQGTGVNSMSTDTHFSVQKKNNSQTGFSSSCILPPLHSLTCPVGQPLASRLREKRFAPWGSTHTSGTGSFLYISSSLVELSPRRPSQQTRFKIFLKGLSNEIYLAESGINQQISLNSSMLTADLLSRILIPLIYIVYRHHRRTSNFVFAAFAIFGGFLQPTRSCCSGG